MNGARSDARTRASWVRLVAAAAASGVLTYLSSAEPIVPALAWIAPVPILALAFAAASTAAHSRAALALAAFLAAFAGDLAWVTLYRGILPIAPLIGFAVLFGTAFSIAVSLTAWSVERRGAWAGILLFPSLWVAFEFAVSRWSPHGTAGSVAYSQVDFVLLIQLAAWTGLWGITFFIQFVAAGAAGLLGAPSTGGRRWAFLAIPAVAVVIVVAMGAWRVQDLDGERRVLVGLTSIDDGMRRFATTRRDEAMPIVSSYLDAVERLAGRQVEAVVMPEKMVGVAPPYEGEVSDLFAAAAEQHQVLLIAGLNLVGRKQARNVAVVFSRGRPAVEYDKRRLVPGLERMYTAGETPGFYKAPGGMTGVAICKDMDFVEIGRDYSRAGVGLLFVPAWDFTRDARLHSRMALMRGVEGGYSIARAAASGLLTASDYLGRVVAERPSDAARQSMLFASLPLGRGRTFYGEHGDWFCWTALLAAAVILSAAAATKRSKA